MVRRAKATSEQHRHSTPTDQFDPTAETGVSDEAKFDQLKVRTADPIQEHSADRPGRGNPAERGPRGLAFIDVGDGRRIHLYRNNAMQQVGIRFIAAEGTDPWPSKEDTQFLKDHGFRWRGEEKLWTRQFLTPEDKERLGAMEAAEGTEQAKLARSRLRIQVMQEAEQLFVQLANEIRSRNGLEPIHFSAEQSQGRGA